MEPQRESIYVRTMRASERDAVRDVTPAAYEEYAAIMPAQLWTGGLPASFSKTSTAGVPCTAEPRSFRPILTGATIYSSTSTSTGTTGQGSVPATRPAGRVWSPA
jgi:hypothetical protein